VALKTQATECTRIFAEPFGTSVACVGKSLRDRLIKVNRSFREWLKTMGVKTNEIETPGMDTWMVWRRNLAQFVGLLFR
jgi:enterochelin esterase-like enzyme